MMQSVVDSKRKVLPPGTTALAVAVLLLFAAAPPSFGLAIHFKLSGSYSHLAPGDVNRSLDGWRDFVERTATSKTNWAFEGGKTGRLRGGFDLEGEILFNLSPRWAIGLGSGYSYRAVTESATTLTVLRASIPFLYARPTKVTATPLVLSGYGFLPLGPRLSLYLRGGIGWLWARYADSEALKRESAANFVFSNARTASRRAALTLAGAGIKYAYDGSLGFFLESVWRKAKVDALRSGTGTLYFFEEYDPVLDFWQAKMSLLDAPPAGETFRSVRKAVVDYGGLILKIGFFIKF